LIWIIFVGAVLNWLEIELSMIVLIYFFSVILLGNYYRVKDQPTIDKSKANTLSIVVAGLGQVYSRYIKLGFILMAIQVLTFFSLLISWITGEEFLVVLVILTILSVIHTNFTAGRMNDKRLKVLMQKVAAAQYKRLKSVIDAGAIFSPDTNILMHEQLTLVAAFRDSDVNMYVSKQVLKELDGLKNNSNASVRKKAQYGFDVLELYQKDGRIKFLEIPSQSYLKKKNLTGGPDEKIIASCLQQKEEQVPVVFLSNDKGARLLARDAGIPLSNV